jgi:hypothetical protein
MVLVLWAPKPPKHILSASALATAGSRRAQPETAGGPARVHIEYCRVLTTSGLNFKVETERLLTDGPPQRVLGLFAGITPRKTQGGVWRVSSYFGQIGRHGTRGKVLVLAARNTDAAQVETRGNTAAETLTAGGSGAGAGCTEHRRCVSYPAGRNLAAERLTGGGMRTRYSMPRVGGPMWSISPSANSSCAQEKRPLPKAKAAEEKRGARATPLRPA